MTTALFVGRFQPFHLGHLKTIQDILELHDKIVIIIGATDKSNTFKNPFTGDEREEMVKLALQEAQIPENRYEFLQVPDVEDDVAWTESIFKQTNSDTAYTNNNWTKRCLELKQIPIKPTPHFYGNYSATKIRDKISQNLPWEDLVPSSVYSYIFQIKGDQRIRDLYRD